MTADAPAIKIKEISSEIRMVFAVFDFIRNSAPYKWFVVLIQGELAEKSLLKTVYYILLYPIRRFYDK